MDELESLYKAHNDPVLRLNLSVPRALYISAAFAAFINEQQRDTHMAVRYRETSAISAVNDVSAGESDMGIIRYQAIYEPYFLGLIKNNWLQYEVLRKFRHCLVMSKRHALAGMEEIPYHVYDRGSQLDLLERVTDTFMQVSPLLQSVLDQHHSVQRESVPAGSLTRDVLIYPVDTELSPCCREFMGFLKGLAPDFIL